MGETVGQTVPAYEPVQETLTVAQPLFHMLLGARAVLDHTSGAAARAGVTGRGHRDALPEDAAPVDPRPDALPQPLRGLPVRPFLLLGDVRSEFVLGSRTAFEVRDFAMNMF